MSDDRAHARSPLPFGPDADRDGPPAPLFDVAYLARRGCDGRTLEAVVTIAIEIAREGREGRRIGTIFTIGDHEAVLAASRPLVLDPLAGHPDDVKRLSNPDMRETVKELAQLDGGFVVSNDGVVVSAARYFDAAGAAADVPLGLGTRHIAAASVTRRTDAVAVVVSESGMVRVFDDGELVGEIVPEVWMLKRYETLIRGRVVQTRSEDVGVMAKED